MVKELRKDPHKWADSVEKKFYLLSFVVAFLLALVAYLSFVLYEQNRSIEILQDDTLFLKKASNILDKQDQAIMRLTDAKNSTTSPHECEGYDYLQHFMTEEEKALFKTC